VVVGERLLRHLLRGVGRSHLHDALVDLGARGGRIDAVQIACDKLERRVAKGGAAAIGHRDPAVNVGDLVVTRNCQHVVSVPFQVGRQVRCFDAMPRSAVVAE